MGEHISGGLVSGRPAARPSHDRLEASNVTSTAEHTMDEHRMEAHATLGRSRPDHRRQQLIAELDDLRRRVETLRAELDERSDEDVGVERASEALASAATSRRRLLHLAGASALGAVGGVAAAGRPAAAADPNDVVKGVPNAVADTTTLDGGFPGPVLSLFNRSGAATASGLYASSSAPAATIRADNDAAVAAVGIAGNAPAGRDLHATGSGRIGMEDHAFGGGNDYAAGELHQFGGTFYAMVTDVVRRVVASPAAAGALFPIEPVRVYDSRLPAPFFGRLVAGQSRTVSIDDARDRVTGEVVQPGVVPADATAIVFNLTVARTAGRGYLSVTPEPTADPPTSTVNWASNDAVVANSSMVARGGGGGVSVYCGGPGSSTDFIIDVVGYHR